MFCLFKVYVKTIKIHFEQDLLLLKTASMNIKVQPVVILNIQCLTDMRSF